MNTGKDMRGNLKKSTFNILAVSMLTLGASTSALAGTVGGSVSEINDISYTAFSSITVVAKTGQTDTVVASGTINNNMSTGWGLTVLSSNSGKLKRVGSGGGVGNEILYSNLKMVKTGGTLGAGLTDPAAVAKDITPGIVLFRTEPGTATTATVDYTFNLTISWDSDPDLLEGTYTDTYTVSLVTLS
jgi:hypothetical protein